MVYEQHLTLRCEATGFNLHGRRYVDLSTSPTVGVHLEVLPGISLTVAEVGEIDERRGVIFEELDFERQSDVHEMLSKLEDDFLTGHIGWSFDPIVSFDDCGV